MEVFTWSLGQYPKVSMHTCIYIGWIEKIVGPGTCHPNALCRMYTAANIFLGCRVWWMAFVSRLIPKQVQVDLLENTPSFQFGDSCFQVLGGLGGMLPRNAWIAFRWYESLVGSPIPTCNLFQWSWNIRWTEVAGVPWRKIGAQKKWIKTPVGWYRQWSVTCLDIIITIIAIIIIITIIIISIIMSNFPVGFKPPKEGPSKGKVAKRTPAGGFFFGYFCCFLGNGGNDNPTGKW